MSTIQKSILAVALVASTCSGNAANMCKDFEIALKNESGDEFIITGVELTEGAYSTKGIGKLSKNETHVLSVARASKEKEMKGLFKIHTPTIPMNNINILFTLKNTGIYCSVKHITATGDYNVSGARSIYRETFTIHHKVTI